MDCWWVFYGVLGMWRATQKTHQWTRQPRALVVIDPRFALGDAERAAQFLIDLRDATLGL